jgi:phosphoserine phosphatase
MDVFLERLVQDKVPRSEGNPELQKFLKTLGGVDAAAIDKASVVENASLLLERWSNHDLPKSHRAGAKDTFMNIVAMLKGTTVEAAAAAAKRSYTEGSTNFPPWTKRIFADRSGCGMRKVVQVLQKMGVDVYVLSATLDPLAVEGAKMLGVPEDHALGSVLEVADGKYTGKVAASTYYTKGAITRQWLPAPPLFVFGDSPRSDFSMLMEAVGPAFMINARDSFIERDDKEAGSRFVRVGFEATEEEPWASTKD